jgi:serine/threonine protein kinase/tetratricopeptide (TPR) repeat protein
MAPESLPGPDPRSPADQAPESSGDTTVAGAIVDSLFGPYRLLSKLGSGGMGTVYRAEVVADRASPLRSGDQVALKLVHSHVLDQKVSLKRFLREVEIGKAIRHPNVVPTYDAGVHVRKGQYLHYLVMEYVEGQTLRSLLAELGRVPERLCRHIAREVTQGLAAIHAAGAVHRDLKPENVLITRDEVVKVMDLGVALVQAETLRLSQSGLFVGSVLYAAPEQLESGGKGIDGRADLHALGVVLYELSTARHPFADPEIGVVFKRVLAEKPQRLGELNPQLSPFFEELVQTLLEKDRERRFGSAAELLAILDQGEEATWWRERTRAIRLETRRPLRRIRIPRETALYGREQELAQLRALYEKAKTGEGQVVLLEGEAGIGKTRLVDEFIGGLEQEGEELNFLFGSYPPGGVATATGAFTTAYREQFGEEGLETTLGRYLVATPLLAPAFAALLRGDAPPPGAEPLTKDSLQTVFVHATRALSAERPTVVMIDDLHFAPEEGRALFLALALAAPGHRLLLVGTARPGVPEAWTASVTRPNHASRFDLPRLEAKDLAHLLTDVFRSERLAEELTLQIATKSDGNPFFVFEIVRGLREGEFVTQGPDGTWVRTRDIGEIQIPSSVMDLIQARIAELEEEDRELLDVAACWGFEFDPTLVAEALGMGVLPALRRFGQIEKVERLVRSAGRSYVFDHHQVQEALYAGLFEPLRERYHAALAGALEVREAAAEKDPKELDGGVAVALGEHFLRGGHGERALRYLDRAIDHLRKRNQNVAALELADRALAAPRLLAGRRRLDVLICRIELLGGLGLPEAERTALEEARGLAEAIGDPSLQARVLSSLGWHFNRITLDDEASHALTEALELASRARDQSAEARAHLILGISRARLGNPAEARDHYERALALAGELGDRMEESKALGNIGLLCCDLAQYEEAEAYLKRQLTITRAIRFLHGEVLATGNLGFVFCDVGRYREGLDLTERSLGLCREVGDRRSECALTGNLGNLCSALGRFEEARAHFAHSLRLSREVENRDNEVTAVYGLAELSLKLGRLEEARHHVEQELDIAREINALRGEVDGLILLALLHAWVGDFTRARGAVEASQSVSPKLKNRRFDANMLHMGGFVEEQVGEFAGAKRMYRESLTLRREIGHLSGVADTLSALGGILAREGRSEEARTCLTEAVALAHATGNASPEAIAASYLALLPGGDPTTAVADYLTHESRLGQRDRMEARFLFWKATGERSHLDEAHRILLDMRDHAPREYRETMIVHVPLYRDIQAEWAAQVRVNGTTGSRIVKSRRP